MIAGFLLYSMEACSKRERTTPRLHRLISPPRSPGRFPSRRRRDAKDEPSRNVSHNRRFVQEMSRMVSRVMSFRSIAFALLLAGMGCSQKMITSLPGADQTGVRLPNGWHLTPAGQTIGVGDLPMNLAVSHDRRLIAVTNNGESARSSELIDVPGARVIDVMPIPQSWLGIEFARDDRRIYASAGNLNSIRIYTVEKNSLRLQDSIVLGKAWPVRISPTGLALDESRDRLYVVTKENNSLYVVDLRTKSILKRDTLEGEAYTCILSPDHATLYVSVWGNKNVCVYDTRSDSITTRIPTGRNPNDLCLTKDGLYLFVANSQDNSISVIDTRRNEVLETLNAAMFPQCPEGSTTNSIGLSEDGRTLYAANADNNCLAVFNVERPGHSVSRGFIPTGWYPTCVRVVDGLVWVANGKGISSLPNPRGPNPSRRRGKAEESKRREQYIGGLLKGTINVLREPDEAQLAQYSRMVYRNSPYSPSGASTAEGESGNPIPVRPGDPSPIKHVFYVIKENRTYDQVLGDEPRGNGDTSLCLFPERITPNEDALAREFVLLDNFYVDGEVSADGHNWSTAAYANDFIEKTWPTRYGGRGGEYDYIGNRSIALPLNGFIWDDCLAHHVSFRNYGEFGDEGPPKLKSLTEQTCRAYPGWNLKIKDTTRERVWEHDFDSLLAANALPAM